jgi:hypothetical protein
MTDTKVLTESRIAKETNIPNCGSVRVEVDKEKNQKDSSHTQPCSGVEEDIIHGQNSVGQTMRIDDTLVKDTKGLKNTCVHKKAKWKKTIWF